jgi:hypothetical protein
MQASASKGPHDGLKRDLTLILLASLAVVVVLTIVLADGAGLATRGLSVRDPLVFTRRLAAAHCSAIAAGPRRAGS